VLAGLWGEDHELLFRRGWTHGVLAMLVLPLLLGAGVWLWHRWRGHASAGVSTRANANTSTNAPAFRPRAVLALAFLGVWSHPLLDWLNTYGVRLLMPFDGRWFYGDTLFIIEPWFWLLTAAGVMLARSANRRSLVAWTVLALLASALVLGTDMVPLAVKLVWCAGVLSLGVLRWWRPRRVSADTLSRAGLALLVVYVGASHVLARQAESRAAQRFGDVQQVQANPLPGNPFAHRLVMVREDRYDILAGDGTIHEVPRQPPDAVVRAALADRSIRGFTNWMRHPHWTVEERYDHWLVHIQDLRYQGPDMTSSRGIGSVRVTVPKGESR
jgi:inner membrane protein